MNNEVVLRFNKVSFDYGCNVPILKEADFSIRKGSKITLMGQNGAGKSTIFQLITNNLEPEDGMLSIGPKLTIATAKQVIQKDQMELTVRSFFEQAFTEKKYDIDHRIKKILKIVNFDTSLDKKIKEFSGGQQAKLLLSFALIQSPDILLLDEPTNNLDKTGIEHLKQFLIDYKKTCIVISHDADFLNSFTQGILYLDIFTHKLEQYVGNYFDVVIEINKRIERERMKNVRLMRDIENRRKQVSFFAQKGGHMRDVAKKMNKKIHELEGEMVEMRQEDKTIRKFHIPCQDISGQIIHIKSISIVKNNKLVKKKTDIALHKKQKILLVGPNGIGKTTFLELITSGKSKDNIITPDVKVGYYRQNFSTLNFEETAYKSLANVIEGGTESELRSTAAGFLINAEMLKKKIGSLSEGQKGLLLFAHLVLQKPNLLILDEPTNHINFRHIPIISDALNRYEGAVILVSHSTDLIAKLKIDEVVDLENIKLKYF